MEVLCFLLILVTHSWAQQGSPVVTIDSGSLRGSIMTSRLEKPIKAFRGIPYAKPPVGNLRFQPPVAAEPWDGILDATEDGLSCPPSQSGAELPTGEACLTLNVYTTELAGVKGGRKKPVIVFFHPGAWYSFTSNSRVFGPQYLLDQEVVLVVPNYRLGPLGYLSMDDNVLSGNYGMKDQVAALRWVKRNIAAFGGDPDCVTIAGYSAGSASVMLHMVSPMSRGLFHRAIASSGSAFSLWSIQKDPIHWARRFARQFNCSTETSQQIKDCLMKLDAQEMADNVFTLAEWGDTPLIFAPTIETATEGERFLVEHPVESFRSGNFAKVPIITGMTKDELGWISFVLLANETYTRDVNERLDVVLPIAFQYERNTPRSRYITSELKKLYFQNRPIDNSTANDLANMYRDAVVGYGEDIASKVISQHTRLYYYQFSYQGNYSWIYLPNTTIPYGVVHHDDLMYCFYIEVLFPFFTPEYPEVKTVERLTTLWANFAKTGNPTPRKSETLQNVIWEPLTTQSLNYLDIGSDLQMKTGLFQDTMPLWGSLIYPEIFPSGVKGSRYT